MDERSANDGTQDQGEARARASRPRAVPECVLLQCLLGQKPNVKEHGAFPVEGGVVPFSWTVIRGGDGHGEVHEGTAATRGRVVCEIRVLRGGCDPRAGVIPAGRRCACGTGVSVQ